MISGNTIPMLIALMGIACYFLRIYFPFPPVLVIGIDLGTSFSACAYFNNGFGNVSLIYDRKNKSFFPSMITIYENGTTSVGEYPDPADIHKHVIFYDSKRYIGRHNLTPEQVLAYPFKIDLVDGKVKYIVPRDFKTKSPSLSLSPSDLATLIIMHIKEIFKMKFGYYPKRAVIGVPVEFDELQRNETIRAAGRAGLEVLRLVNEPTAASMACDVHNRPEIENVVVLDLGGGTYDVAVLSSHERTLNTLSIAGNDRLGGRDFTNQFATCFIERADNISDFINQEHEEFVKIVENAKIDLSTQLSIQVSFFKNSRQWTMHTTRDEFDKCTERLFNKLIKPIELALEEARMKVDEVQEIVLVGGATRMPKFRTIIKDFFKREPNLSVDPDTAVVIGLANQAGILSQGWPLEKAAIDILPKSLKKIKVT